MSIKQNIDSFVRYATAAGTPLIHFAVYRVKEGFEEQSVAALKPSLFLSSKFWLEVSHHELNEHRALKAIKDDSFLLIRLFKV
jgi:hypothetical protein